MQNITLFYILDPDQGSCFVYLSDISIALMSKVREVYKMGDFEDVDDNEFDQKSIKLIEMNKCKKVIDVSNSALDVIFDILNEHGYTEKFGPFLKIL